MRARQGVVPGYDAQAVVCPLAEEGGVAGVLVTAVEVVDEANDAAQLTPMVEQTEEITGIRVPMTLADVGYFAGKPVSEFHRMGQQVVVPDLAHPTNHPYHKDLFIYDHENDSYIRPHGQRLHPAKFKDNKNTKARVYRIASASTCRDCTAFGVCTTNASHGRTVEIGITRGGASSSQVVDGYRRSPAGIPAAFGVGRAALCFPQEPTGTPAVHVAGHEQREGRMGHVGHCLQPKNLVASVASPGHPEPGLHLTGHLPW